MNEEQKKTFVELKELLSEIYDHILCKAWAEYDECVCEHCYWRNDIIETLKELENSGL